jgi:hypothetical protein
MKRNLARKSVVLGAGGMLAVGLLSTAATAASAATNANAAVAQAHGPSWRTVLSVANGTKTGLFDTVVATGKTSGWAFRSDGTAYTRTGAATWRKVAFPGQGGAVNVAGASSPSNVWAAYDTASGTRLYHWSGRTWTLAKSFPHGGSLTALSVLGPSDVWAFGGTGSTGTDGVFHFNGRTWTEVSKTPQGGNALSDGAVWAYSGTQLEFFNGRRWTAANVAKLLPSGATLAGVIALAPNNVYATAGTNNPGRGVVELTVLHFNGRTWSKAAAASGIYTDSGRSLVSDGQGGLWLVGETSGVSEGNPESSLHLLRYSAGRLTTVTVPSTGVTAVSRVPGTAEELASGEQYGTGNGNSVVLQYS